MTAVLYLDTSAFVKLILEHEPGAGEVREWFTRADHACLSVITYPEATSALCRHDREVGSDTARLDAWLRALRDFWQSCVRAVVPEESAARLGRLHSLRGMDAVQLSTAPDIRERILTDTPTAEVLFAAFDRRLLEAAEREGFATLGGALS